MQKIKDIHFMEEGEGRVVLFTPLFPIKRKSLFATALTRWAGQGPKVDLFERKFADFIGSDCSPVAVGSGTDALHLSYVLSGISPGDEVVSPLFTCTATNIPFLNMGASDFFADAWQDTLNIDPNHRQILDERAYQGNSLRSLRRASMRYGRTKANCGRMEGAYH